MDRKIQELVKQGIHRIVITDVRFLDEFEFVKRWGVKSGLSESAGSLQKPIRHGYMIKVHSNIYNNF